MTNLRPELALSMLAGAASVLGACGSDGPRWAKRADQIDLAAWKAVCGEKHDVHDAEPISVDGHTVDPGYHNETFSRPAPGDMLKPPYVDCTFARGLRGQRLIRAHIDARGRPAELTPELRQRLTALLADLLPPSVHPALHEVASSRGKIRLVSHGFRIIGGEEMSGASDDPSVHWTLWVDSRPHM